MNGRKLKQHLARFALVALMGGILAACTHAPAAREQMSILDALDSQQQSSPGPASCASLNTTAVCEKSTRLGASRSCRCVDPQALGKPSRL